MDRTANVSNATADAGRSVVARTACFLLRQFSVKRFAFAASSIAQSAALRSIVVFAVLLLGTLPATSMAVVVEQELWGFDGQVVVGHFNPVSFLIVNERGDPFVGDFELVVKEANTVIGTRLIERDVSIAPSGSRWVQFYPFVHAANVTYELRWGLRLGERVELKPTVAGDAAIVLLQSPQGLAAAGGSVKRFPEVIFPPHSTATEGLKQVILDHVPRWEESRRKAFREWLLRGGVVHLLKPADGRPLQFPADLAELNMPVEMNRVGGGIVLRHDISVTELTQERLQKLSDSAGRPNQVPNFIAIPTLGGPGSLFVISGSRLPGLHASVGNTALNTPPVATAPASPVAMPVANGSELSVAVNTPALPSAKTEDWLSPIGNAGPTVVTDWNANVAGVNVSYYNSWQVIEQVMGALKQMTVPNHNWPLLHGLTAAYLLCLFPGGYLVQRYRNDYRLTYAWLVGSILLFGYGYSYVGRRGYGEETSVHSLSVLRPIEPGTWDTMTYGTAFVTAGGDYPLEYTGRDQLWDGASTQERVAAEITNGSPAAMVADIPPFSWRPFIQRRVVESPIIQPTVKKLKIDNNAITAVIEFDRPLPEKSQLAVFYENRILPYAITPTNPPAQNSRVELNGGVGMPLQGMIEQFTPQNRGWGSSQERESAEVLFSRLQPSMYALALGIDQPSVRDRYSVPAGEIRLCLIMPEPPEFRLQTNAALQSDGRVLIMWPFRQTDPKQGDAQ